MDHATPSQRVGGSIPSRRTHSRRPQPCPPAAGALSRDQNTGLVGVNLEGGRLAVYVALVVFDCFEHSHGFGDITSLEADDGRPIGGRDLLELGAERPLPRRTRKGALLASSARQEAWRGVSPVSAIT